MRGSKTSKLYDFWIFGAIINGLFDVSIAYLWLIYGLFMDWLAYLWIINIIFGELILLSAN